MNYFTSSLKTLLVLLEREEFKNVPKPSIMEVGNFVAWTSAATDQKLVLRWAIQGFSFTVIDPVDGEPRLEYFSPAAPWLPQELMTILEGLKH